MTKLEKILFITIALIAIFLRFWQLNKYPVSLNWDEISHGYNAYSLLNTGKDQWGTSWPIFNFRAYGDYPTTLNMYLTIPFVYLFGLNETSVRLPSAILGLGLVFIAFFFGKLLFKKNKPALFLMLLTAISPWTLFPSRAVFQSTVAQFFFALGILLILYALKNRTKLLLPGLFSLVLSTYGYHNTRIATPLIIILMFFIFYKQIFTFFKNHKIYFSTSLIIFFILLVPQVINLFSNSSQARSRWVFIINPASINTINENRNHFTGNKIFGKLIYSKPTYFITEVTKNYVGFINPNNLFFNSTQNYQFNIPNTGVLYPILLPFFYIGIIFLLFDAFKRNKSSLFILGWFVVGLVPAVITSGDFPIIRAMSILPLPQIFITYGFVFFINFFNRNKVKYIFSIIVLIILTIQTVSYLNNYFNQYSTTYSESWQYGYKEAVTYAKDHYQDYDQIIITKKYGEAHEYVLFYWPWNPASYQNDPKKIWDFHADWYWVDGFDKFKFVNDWDIKAATANLPPNQHTLLITSPNNYNQSNTKLLKTINFLDQKPAFDILNIYGKK